MNPVLAVAAALVVLAVLVEAGIFAVVNRVDRRAAAANRLRPARLPRQLVARTQDFDEYGRTW